MDFHSLTRRELQAFCKKNKIPANMTNAAMADALKALEIVEGIEEFMQTSQSETAESSIEALEGSEVTSPYVPPTAGRSTRRRNVVKEELEVVASMVRTTRRTARKTVAKVSDESQVDTAATPAVLAQTGRRKVQMASACRIMDSELKECVDEEKKDVSMTPAVPVGVTSRRRRVEEGTVQKAYSTRRSVRLAGKSVQMMNDVTSEGSELFKSEVLTKDSEEGEEVNQKDGLNDCTDVDATPIVEENYENEVKSEVVEVQPDNTECLGGEDTEMPVYVSDEVQQSEGLFSSDSKSVDVCTSEIEITVENSKEMDIEIVAGDSVEHELLLESKDNFAVDEVSHDEVLCDEAEKEVHNDEDVQGTLLKPQQEDTQVVKMEGDVKEADSDFMETLEVEEREKSGDAELNVEEEAGTAVGSVKNSPSKKLSGVEEDVPLNGEHIPNEYPAVTGFSDNKENSKLVIMNEKMKPAKDNGQILEELSLRKLTKMFKEKLEITKKLSKHGNEATLNRTALQELPENQLVDGNEK
ncbi:hypothetical protein C2S53_007922 [Perilla frutescens var. hirtella]|uniref:Uncharacterized protein n=1 Tax=Perilla frutescens var. hirtella TaxID=608512 RepID=A0AAD4JE24_PERFH|nr:hypothetical protein C2S53_007922 [Perilla frutescens var. hirtella]